jgi:hypothetical protein
MPPKSTRAAARRHGVRNGLEEREVKKVDSGYLGKSNDDDEPASRRKSTSQEKANTVVKTKTLPASPRSDLKASPVQVLKFLLSDAALQVCQPDDELSDVESHGKDVITYSSQLLTPFEELLCAVILSRPISHRLGLRTIRTVLNAPYSFRNAVTIKTAGPKRVLRALEVARTQHKDKTAEEIALLADAVSNNDWHNDLSRLRSQCKNAVESEREVLRRSIKGLGKIGLDIFYRRVQWQWDETFPFIDARTQAVLKKLGLPRRAEGIEKMIEVWWNELGIEDGSDYSPEVKRRRAFVMLLERALGADTGKRIDEVLEEASRI